MRGGTLKCQSLVFKPKALGRGSDDRGVLEMNQHSCSSEQHDRSKRERDQDGKQMRPSFRGWCAHYEKTKLLSRLDAAIEFHFGIWMACSSLWQRFQRYFLEYRELGFSPDISRMKFPEDLFEKMQPRIEQAFAAMRKLEAGAIANPTEKRMIGHYWLRNPGLGPTPEIRTEIQGTINRIKKFAEDVHAGKITAENGKRFKHVLLIGIGGSALGPQFVANALGSEGDPMDIYFLDNTDPDGFDRVFQRIDDLLPQMLVVVVSKSGGTKETRNGMLETEAKFAAKGLQFAKQAVAITGIGS